MKWTPNLEERGDTIIAHNYVPNINLSPCLFCKLELLQSTIYTLVLPNNQPRWCDPNASAGKLKLADKNYIKDIMYVVFNIVVLSLVNVPSYFVVSLNHLYKLGKQD